MRRVHGGASFPSATCILSEASDLHLLDKTVVPRVLKMGGLFAFGSQTSLGMGSQENGWQEEVTSATDPCLAGQEGTHSSRGHRAGH